MNTGAKNEIYIFEIVWIHEWANVAEQLVEVFKHRDFPIPRSDRRMNQRLGSRILVAEDLPLEDYFPAIAGYPSLQTRSANWRGAFQVAADNHCQKRGEVNKKAGNGPRERETERRKPR